MRASTSPGTRSLSSFTKPTAGAPSSARASIRRRVSDSMVGERRPYPTKGRSSKVLTVPVSLLLPCGSCPPARAAVTFNGFSRAADKLSTRVTSGADGPAAGGRRIGAGEGRKVATNRGNPHSSDAGGPQGWARRGVSSLLASGVHEGAPRGDRSPKWSLMGALHRPCRRRGDPAAPTGRSSSHLDARCCSRCFSSFPRSPGPPRRRLATRAAPSTSSASSPGK